MNISKKVLTVTAAVCACVLAVGCGGKKERDEAAVAAETEQVEVEAAEEQPPPPPPTWEGVYHCKAGDPECRDDKLPGEGVYFAGTVFNTRVTAGVNVRNYPSTGGAVLFQIPKDTRIQLLGVTRSGWAFVTTREVVPRRGWIFRSNIEYGERAQLEPIGELSVADFRLASRDSTFADIVLSYKVNDEERRVETRAHKIRGQNFFTFFFDIYEEGSHYGIVPGLYTWDFSRNRLRHAAFMVRSPFISLYPEEILTLYINNTVLLTDDLKFYILMKDTPQAFGEAAVIRVSDNRRMFADVLNMNVMSRYLDWKDDAQLHNYNNLDNTLLRRSTVSIPCPSDAVMSNYYTGLDALDESISDFADNFVEENPRQGLDLTLAVLCDVNLDTGARRITGAEWRWIQ